MRQREPQTLTEIAQRQTVVSEDVIAEIFSGYTYADPDTSLVEIFNAETAELFLARVGKAADLLSADDSYEEAMQKLDAEIARLEATRDELLFQLFEQVRPLEKSYRAMHLFFANADVPGVKTQAPVDLYVFNADPAAIKNPTESPTVEAVKKFTRAKNDSFNFRQAVCNMVLPGYVPDAVRKEFEEISDTYGMLLIGDLKKHDSFDKLIKGFNGNGGIYQALKRPQDQAASDVIMSSHVKLRERHWFEEADGEDGVYGPSSMVFAGTIVRSDRTPGAGIAQGPVGMKYGRIKGVEKARFEPLVSETEELTMNRQLVTIIRNADDDLCFMGNRNQADDPHGTIKFFTTYRVNRFVERMISNYLRQVAYMRLDRKVVDEHVIEPVERFLEDLKKSGTIAGFKLNHDYDTGEYAEGVVSLDLVLEPVGPAETFKVRISTPPKKAAAAAN